MYVPLQYDAVYDYSVLDKLSHPKVVRAFRQWEDWWGGNRVGFLAEELAKGSVRDIIRQNPSGLMQPGLERDMREYAWQALTAVSYVHSEKVRFHLRFLLYRPNVKLVQYEGNFNGVC